MTLHRPALVDGPLLADAIAALDARGATSCPVVFPVHPRTRAALEALGLDAHGRRALRLLDPLGYLEFLSLVEGAAGVLTDSGGIQEETTFLGIPCFTLRDNTERPVTVELGTNVAARPRPRRIDEVPGLIAAARRGRRRSRRWDGRAAGRIVDVLGRVPLGTDRLAATS